MSGLDWRYRVLARVRLFNPNLATVTNTELMRARHHRAPRWATGHPVIDVVTRHIEFPDDDEHWRLRIDEPIGPCSRPLPLLMYIHGGAWMFSDMDTPEWLTTRLASRMRVAVASLDYRLAPEHPFPAALDDCSDALRWLAHNAEAIGADPSRIAMMGDSAGGNLAAVMCLLARDRAGPEICHQTLIYPPLDLTLASPSIDSEGHHGIITRPQMEQIRRLYLNGADPADWRASPLLAENLAGLPPTHIIVADHDTLRDDGVRYAERLQDSGVAVRLSRYAAMTHGFLALRFAPAARRRALADIVNELRRALD